MAETASISSGIAERYATALFEIAEESDTLADLESNVDSLGDALSESPDLRDVISNPLISREDQGKALTRLARKLGLRPYFVRTLQLMASKRRLFVLPHLVTHLRAKLADHKGEMTADVTSAQALTSEQTDALSARLSKSLGKNVKIKSTIDESLIGGLVIKVGSKMIDTSVRSKLNSLQNAMKEVG